jgi:hypothetical protein
VVDGAAVAPTQAMKGLATKATTPTSNVFRFIVSSPLAPLAFLRDESPKFVKRRLLHQLKTQSGSNPHFALCVSVFQVDPSVPIIQPAINLFSTSTLRTSDRDVTISVLDNVLFTQIAKTLARQYPVQEFQLADRNATAFEMGVGLGYICCLTAIFPGLVFSANGIGSVSISRLGLSASLDRKLQRVKVPNLLVKFAVLRGRACEGMIMRRVGCI